MEDTDEDVDLRPRRPVLDRRKVDRGVNGDGEREWRLLLGVVYIRAIGGCDWFAGGKAGLAARAAGWPRWQSWGLSIRWRGSRSSVILSISIILSNTRVVRWLNRSCVSPSRLRIRSTL